MDAQYRKEALMEFSSFSVAIEDCLTQLEEPLAELGTKDDFRRWNVYLHDVKSTLTTFLIELNERKSM